MLINQRLVQTLRAGQTVSLKRNAKQLGSRNFVPRPDFSFVDMDHPIELRDLHYLSDVFRCIGEVNFAAGIVQLNQHAQNTAWQIGRVTKIDDQFQALVVANESRKLFMQVGRSMREIVDLLHESYDADRTSFANLKKVKLRHLSSPSREEFLPESVHRGFVFEQFQQDGLSSR